jgi:hypothetical protein
MILSVEGGTSETLDTGDGKVKRSKRSWISGLRRYLSERTKICECLRRRQEVRLHPEQQELPVKAPCSGLYVIRAGPSHFRDGRTSVSRFERNASSRHWWRMREVQELLFGEIDWRRLCECPTSVNS